MLHEDYLMRMFLLMASSMRESMEKARGERDPEAAAEKLDASLEDATEIDGSLLLRMAPETMAAMLQLSAPDPRLMEYVSRTLLLSSRFSGEAGHEEQAQLRYDQAMAVAQAFNIPLSEEDIEPQRLEELFARTTPVETPEE